MAPSKISTALAILALAQPASAGTKPADDALPGVDPKAGDTVVRAPQPEPTPSTTEDGFTRLGNWDVKISGQVRMDIGAGTLPAKSR